MKRTLSDFFIVDNNADIFFNRPSAEYLSNEIRRRYDLVIPVLEEEDTKHIEDIEEYLAKPQRPIWCEGVDVADFKTLQEMVNKEIGQDKAKHLLAVKANTFFGVYLPIEIEPTRIELPKIQQSGFKPILKKVLRGIFRVKPRASEIDCASLLELKRELDLFATKMNLPKEEKKLKRLSFDLTMIFLNTKRITTLERMKKAYTELMLATNFAVKHNYPLWLR